MQGAKERIFQQLYTRTYFMFKPKRPKMLLVEQASHQQNCLAQQENSLVPGYQR